MDRVQLVLLEQDLCLECVHTSAQGSWKLQFPHWKVGHSTESTASPSVDSNQEGSGQRVGNHFPPMKITYARHLHSRAWPDRGCTDNEKVVVELHHVNAEIPAHNFQGDSRVDSQEEDAPDEGPTGLSGPQLIKVIQHTQPGESVRQLSTIGDNAEGYKFSKPRGSGAFQPITDYVSDHNKSAACEGGTGLCFASMTCDKGELATGLDSKHESPIDLRDSQEWELKLRRDHLEAELQKLDAEIMKTRARLHQRHCVIDREVPMVSTSSFADHPDEGPLKVEKLSKIQQQSTKHLANNIRDNVVLEISSDIQMQEIATSHLRPKSRIDGEKTCASSNSYSDSFLLEDNEMGQRIPERGGSDYFVDQSLGKNSLKLCGKSCRDLQAGSPQFEAVVEGSSRGNQSYPIKKQVEAQSCCKRPSTQEDCPSEGSEISTGRGPGIGLDTPPPVNCEESTARKQASKGGSVPTKSNQMVEGDVGKVQPTIKDERKMLECHNTVIGGLLSVLQNSVSITKVNGRGSRTQRDKGPQPMGERVSWNKGQTSLQDSGRSPGDKRNSDVLPDCGVGESLNSVVQFQNAENTSCLSLWERSCSLAVARGETKSPPCIQQNEWPLEGKEGHVAASDMVEVVPCSIREQEGRIAFGANTLLPVLSSETGTVGVPGTELDNMIQINSEEMGITRTAPAGSQTAELLLSAENSLLILSTEVLPSPLNKIDKYNESTPTPKSLYSGQQTSHIPTENLAQLFPDYDIGPSNKRNVQSEMLDEGKGCTCSEEAKMSNEVATIVPEVFRAASSTPKNNPSGSKTQETDWESLSLPSHMDFSTIKEKLRNNKLANDDITEGWGNYQKKAGTSPSPFSTGRAACGGQAIASERSIESEVPHKSKVIHESSRRPSSTNAGGNSSGGQALASESVESDVPHHIENLHENSMSPSSLKIGGDYIAQQTRANDRVMTPHGSNSSNSKRENSSSASSSTKGGDSSSGQTISERIISSDVWIIGQDHENSSLKIEQEANCKYASGMDTDQDDNFLPLYGQSKGTNIKANPSPQHAQVLITPYSSTREMPSFLPSLYFHHHMTKSNCSEEGESTISEDLENCDSGVDEDLQNDVGGTSSGNLEVTSTWEASSVPFNNSFISTGPDSSYCLQAESPNEPIFHSKTGLSVTKVLTCGMDHFCQNVSSDCIDQDSSTGGVDPCGASGPGRPTKVCLGQSNNQPSLHNRDQDKNALATWFPRGSDAAGIGSLQIIKNTKTEDNTLQELTRVSDAYYCGSEVSGSHLQSESGSEDVHSNDCESASKCLEPLKKTGHLLDLVELKTWQEPNEESDTLNSGGDGNDYHGNKVMSSATPKTDFLENGDRQDSIVFPGHITSAGILTNGIPDLNSFSTASITAAGSQHHALLLSSHVKSGSTKPVELLTSVMIPPLRLSEDFSSQSSKVSSAGNLHKESPFGETINTDEEHLLETMSPQIEATFTKRVLETSTTLPPMSTSHPGEMVKFASNSFCSEKSNSGTICNLEVVGAEGNSIPGRKKKIDLEVFDCSSHQIVQRGDANLSVDAAQSIDCNNKNSLAGELGETAELSNKFLKIPILFRGPNPPSGMGHVEIISADEEVIESVGVVPSGEISGYPTSVVGKLPYQDRGLIASIRQDWASHSAFADNDAVDSCLHITSTSEENQLSDECRITDIDSTGSFDSCTVDKSNSGSPTSVHQIVSAKRDLLSLPETKDSSLRFDQISSFQHCEAIPFNNTSLHGHQQSKIDFAKVSEDQAQDNPCSELVNIECNCNKTGTELKGNINDPACSLQVLQTDLDDMISERTSDCCDSKEEFLSQSSKYTARTKLPPISVLPKFPRAEDPEARSVNSLSFNELLNSGQDNKDKQRSLISMKEKALLRSREIDEDAAIHGSKQISSSRVREEQIISTACLTSLKQASSCSVTKSPSKLRGVVKNICMQVDAKRAEKHNIMADLLTSMIYEDLLSVELSGFHQRGGRITISPTIFGQTNEMVNFTKTLSPKLKSKSRRVSKFCQVLKHFLPTGWRATSVRHKTGLFLHVEGLRPHPLNSATRAIGGTLKLGAQYPSYENSDWFSQAPSTQFLLLDLNDVFSCVQRLFELSNLNLDPSLANWFHLKKPVAEHNLLAWDNQCWETTHIFRNSKWKIPKKLMSDLINETLLKQFASRLVVPTLGMRTLPLPIGGEDLVHFVANGIVEHERHASSNGFDIEKVIAKAFEDEHWEKCSDEARDVVGDLAQDILGDLIESFVYEMTRGWHYYVNQCHILAC